MQMKWYKRDPAVALDGMSVLSLEERGAYNTILDLIYARDGAVDDDPRFIAGWLRCDVRVWNRIRRRLIALDKLYVRDGSLRNRKADVVVDEALRRADRRAEAGHINGIKSGASRRRNKELAEPNLQGETNIARARTRYIDSSLSEDGEESEVSKIRLTLSDYDFLSTDGSVMITAEEFEKLQADLSAISDLRAVVRHACRTWLAGIEPPERRKPRLIEWLRTKNVEKAGRKERAATSKAESAPSPQDGLTDRQRRFAADKEREAASERAIEFRRRQDEERRRRQEASHDT
jgi:hypothetical protein